MLFILSSLLTLHNTSSTNTTSSLWMLNASPSNTPGTFNFNPSAYSPTHNYSLSLSIIYNTSSYKASTSSHTTLPFHTLTLFTTTTSLFPTTSPSHNPSTTYFNTSSFLHTSLSPPSYKHTLYSHTSPYASHTPKNTFYLSPLFTLYTYVGGYAPPHIPPHPKQNNTQGPRFVTFLQILKKLIVFLSKKLKTY